MARSKRRQDTGILGTIYIALVAIGTILLTALVYTPILLFAALAVTYAKGGWRKPEDAIPSEVIDALDELEDELVAKLRRLGEVEREGAEADLSINVDGSFHRGSRLGKRLNTEMELLCPRIEELRDLTEDLRAGPLAGFKRSIHLYAAYHALLLSLAFYTIVFSYCYFIDPSASSALSPFVAEHVLVRLQGMEPYGHGAAVIAGLVSLITLPVLYAAARWRLSSRYAALRQAYADFAASTVGNRYLLVRELPIASRDETPTMA